jgi:hypothetical protein
MEFLLGLTIGTSLGASLGVLVVAWLRTCKDEGRRHDYPKPDRSALNEDLPGTRVMRVSRPGVSGKAHGATDAGKMREHDTRQIVDPVVTGERPERSNDPI